MDSSSSSSGGGAGGGRVRASKRPLGLFQNAMKLKHRYVQFFAMTGVLMLSMRSLGQKHRIHDLQEDRRVLRDEQESLTERMKKIKSALLKEASLDSTGVFASRLRLLFADEP